MSETRRPLIPDDSWGGEDYAMKVVCPVCGCEFCHMQSVAVKQNDRVDIVTRERSDRVTSKSLANKERGSVVLLTMWCESGGHEFSLRLQFHKGSTYLFPEYVRDIDGPISELWRD